MGNFIDHQYSADVHIIQICMSKANPVVNPDLNPNIHK